MPTEPTRLRPDPDRAELRPHSVAGCSGSSAHTARRALAVTAAILGLLLVARDAAAKDCGGGVPCECGDRMIASTTLDSDLTNCKPRGLEVAAGVLDCAGHLIAGPGDRVRGEGIALTAAGGGVRNCVVRNFARGILVDRGSDNLVVACDLFNNNAGIWLGDGSTRNVIRSVDVHDNRDEGIHVGGGTSENQILDSRIVANRNENLYLINTARNRVINNLLDQGTEAAIHLKNADDNYFAKNVVAKKGVAVRGDSSGNVFENNQILAGRYTFEAIETPDDEWLYPHGNTVTGGRVIKASTCFYFFGAYENTATSVLADRCRPIQEKKGGGLLPYGNTVDVHYGGDPGTGGGGGGGGDPDQPSYPKGTIKFDDPGVGNDSLKISGILETDLTLDAIHSDVRFRLADADGITFEVFVPAGVLRESGRSAKYENGDGIALPGVRSIEIRREGANGYSFKLVARTDLSGANQAGMLLLVAVGDDEFSFPDIWTGTSEGWRLR